MTWLWIILYGVAGLALILALLGFSLHRIGKSLPEEHTHICSVTLHQPPEKLYEAIADIAAWPTWDSGVQRVEGQADAGGVFRGKMFLGRNVMGIESRPVAPPRRHEIHVEDLRMRIFSGVWRYELSPNAAGCTITLTEEGRIRSPIPRATARRCGDPKMYIKRHLKLLARKFGEGAKIE